MYNSVSKIWISRPKNFVSSSTEIDFNWRSHFSDGEAHSPLLRFNIDMLAFFFYHSFKNSLGMYQNVCGRFKIESQLIL